MGAADAQDAGHWCGMGAADAHDEGRWRDMGAGDAQDAGRWRGMGAADGRCRWLGLCAGSGQLVLAWNLL